MTSYLFRGNLQPVMVQRQGSKKLGVLYVLKASKGLKDLKISRNNSSDILKDFCSMLAFDANDRPCLDLYAIIIISRKLKHGFRCEKCSCLSLRRTLVNVVRVLLKPMLYLSYYKHWLQL